MELREELKTHQQPPESLAPLTIPNFHLLSEPITDILLVNHVVNDNDTEEEQAQGSLF